VARRNRAFSLVNDLLGSRTLGGPSASVGSGRLSREGAGRDADLLRSLDVQEGGTSPFAQTSFFLNQDRQRVARSNARSATTSISDMLAQAGGVARAIASIPGPAGFVGALAGEITGEVAGLRVPPEQRGISPEQILGLGIGSTALQTFSAFRGISSQEKDALNTLAQRSESAEIRNRLRTFDQEQRAFDRALATLDQIRSQAPAGGEQRQLFIRDPGTGRLLT